MCPKYNPSIPVHERPSLWGGRVSESSSLSVYDTENRGGGGEEGAWGWEGG